MCTADKFPEALPGFQKMFPDDSACALYLESIRWRDGFVCPRCASTAAPTRIPATSLLATRSSALLGDHVGHSMMCSQTNTETRPK